MSTRHALYGLLVMVVTAAAVISFSALRDLALLCWFSSRLAWLLPVVVNAGAAAGSRFRLRRHPARRGAAMPPPCYPSPSADTDF